MSKKAKGNRGEERAAAFLVENGLRIAARNFRIDGGEIDIVATSPAMFIFVEVKFRSEGSYIDALERISPAQTTRIRFTPQHYLLQHGLNQHQLRLRFDVITITGPNADLYWLKDAF